MIFNYGDDFIVNDELIPACGTPRPIAQVDPREPQITLHRTYGKKTTTRSDFEKGELIFHCGDRAPSLSEIKYAAAEHRKSGVLNRIILLIEPDLYPELYAWCIVNKFERDITHEVARQREIALVRYCKVKKQ